MKGVDDIKGNLLDNNFETNYSVGEQFTTGHMSRTIMDTRKDKDGYNEYLLDNDEWVTGKYITLCSD